MTFEKKWTKTFNLPEYHIFKISCRKLRGMFYLLSRYGVQRWNLRVLEMFCSLYQSLHSDKKSVIAVRDSLKELASAGDEYHLKMVKFAEELKRFGQQVSCSEPNIGEECICNMTLLSYGIVGKHY